MILLMPTGRIVKIACLCNLNNQLTEFGTRYRPAGSLNANRQRLCNDLFPGFIHSNENCTSK
jgi:hypothetical protein